MGVVASPIYAYMCIPVDWNLLGGRNDAVLLFSLQHEERRHTAKGPHSFTESHERFKVNALLMVEMQLHTLNFASPLAPACPAAGPQGHLSPTPSETSLPVAMFPMNLSVHIHLFSSAVIGF